MESRQILSEKIQQLLKQYWGYDAFRPLQEDIMLSALSGQDTIALLPTGAGKSLCYQIPALALEGKTIIVSPLIALMQDQVFRLQQLDIKAASLHSGLHYFDMDRIIDNFVFGDLKMLYISPERLKSDTFIQRMAKADIALIVIDEAHCISQWGHDFRPAYLEIADSRTYFPKAVMMALTATATDHVISDLQTQLKLRQPAIFRQSFMRTNLGLIIIETEDKMGELRNLISRVKGAIIVYVRNRRSTVELNDWLNSIGISSVAYHAGMDKQHREASFRAWLDNRCRAVVCTNAFGMGIDKPDVRLVVHMDIPPSIEEYYQEVGRGGRDQKLAYGVAIIGKQNYLEAVENVHDRFPEFDYIASIYVKLHDYLEIDMGEGQYAQSIFDMLDFAKWSGEPMKKVFHAMTILEKEGWILLSDALKEPSRVMITTDHTQLRFTDAIAELKQTIITYLLRNHEGLFTDMVKIDEERMAVYLKKEVAQIIKILEILHQEQIIYYQPKVDAPQITILQPRVIKKSFTIDKKTYSKQKQLAETRIKSMISLMQHDDVCRMQYISAYFGEKADTCGNCDFCIGVNKESLTIDQERQVIDHLKQSIIHGPVHLQAYVMQYPFNKRKRIINTIKNYAYERKLDINNQGMITLPS